MKRLFRLTCLALTLAAVLAACGGGNGNTGAQQGHSYVGSFTDEYGNRFTLNEDYTATIQFQGMDSVINVTWFDGVEHDQPYASIYYNGNPTHYILRDGVLYRGKDAMINGRPAIKIVYDK